MSDTLTKLLRDDLRRHDWTDPIFKALVADPDGVPDPIVRPTDYNQGAIASVLEYTRQLALCLILEFTLSNASTRWLNFSLERFLDLPRFPGETDAVWLARVTNIMFGNRCSCNAIVDALLPYSSPSEPTCTSGDTAFAYADLSYADVYSSFQNTAPGPEFGQWVFPAMTTDGSGLLFYFIVTLQNLQNDDVAKVFAIINRIKAAGTQYDVRVTF